MAGQKCKERKHQYCTIELRNQLYNKSQEKNDIMEFFLENRPAMAPVPANGHSFALGKAHSLEHTADFHAEHVLAHIQLCTHYTLA